MATRHTGCSSRFEGGDGAGKSTQVAPARATVAPRTGVDVLDDPRARRHALGRQLRDLVLARRPVGPRAEALMYAADKAHHVADGDRAGPRRGAIVITDRYVDSSIAYQGAGATSASTRRSRRSIAGRPTAWSPTSPSSSTCRRFGRGRRGDVHDRLEREGDDFHEPPRAGFLAAGRGRTRTVTWWSTPPCPSRRSRALVAAAVAATAWGCPDDGLGRRRRSAGRREGPQAAVTDPAAMTHAWLFTGPPGLRPLGGGPGVRRRAAVPGRRLRHTAASAAPRGTAPTPMSPSSRPRAVDQGRPGARPGPGGAARGRRSAAGGS